MCVDVDMNDFGRKDTIVQQECIILCYWQPRSSRPRFADTCARQFWQAHWCFGVSASRLKSGVVRGFTTAACVRVSGRGLSRNVWGWAGMGVPGRAWMERAMKDDDLGTAVQLWIHSWSSWVNSDGQYLDGSLSQVAVDGDCWRRVLDVGQYLA